MRDVTDEVLVRRVTQSGDERAISKRYDRYAGLIYGVGDGSTWGTGRSRRISSRTRSRRCGGVLGV